MRQLIEDASYGPDVDGRRVRLGAQQNLRRPIPQSNHFMSVTLERQSIGARKAKVGQLDLVFVLVDEDVAWLEVAVHYASLMTMQQGL